MYNESDYTNNTLNSWEGYILQLTQSVMFLGGKDTSVDAATATISKSFGVFTTVCRDQTNYYQPVYEHLHLLPPCGRMLVEPHPITAKDSDLNINWNFSAPTGLGVNLTWSRFHLRTYHGSCLVERLTISNLVTRPEIYCGYMSPWIRLVQSSNMHMTYTNQLIQKELNKTQFFGFVAHYSFYNIREAFGPEIYTIRIKGEGKHHGQLQFDRLELQQSFTMTVESLPGFVTESAATHTVLIQADITSVVSVSDWKTADPLCTELQLYDGPTKEAKLLTNNNLSSESFVVLLVATYQLMKGSCVSTINGNLTVKISERISHSIRATQESQVLHLGEYCGDKVVCDVTFTAAQWYYYPKYVDVSVIGLSSNSTNPAGCMNYGLGIINLYPNWESMHRSFFSPDFVLYLCDKSHVWNDDTQLPWPHRTVSRSDRIRVIYYQFPQRERKFLVKLLAKTSLCYPLNPSHKEELLLTNLRRRDQINMPYKNGNFVCSGPEFLSYVTIPYMKICFGNNGTHRAVTIKATLDIGCLVLQQLLQTIGGELPIIVSIESLGGHQLISSKWRFKTLKTNFCKTRPVILDSNVITIHPQCTSAISDVKLQLKAPVMMKGTRLKQFDFANNGFYHERHYFNVKIVTEVLFAYPHQTRHMLDFHNIRKDSLYFLLHTILDNTLLESSVTRYTFSLNGSNCENWGSINYRMVLISSPLTYYIPKKMTLSASVNGSINFAARESISVTNTQTAKLHFLFFDIDSPAIGNCSIVILTELVSISQVLGFPSQSHCGPWCDKYTREYIIVWEEISASWTDVHEACSLYGAHLPSIHSKTDEHLLKKLITGEKLGSNGQEFYLSPARLHQNTLIPVGLNIGKVI